MGSKIDNLASQLQAMAAPSGPQLSVSQGVITAWAPSTTPPTVSLTLSGSATPIAGVRYAASYTPNVGDTVQVLKQGGQLLVLCRIANAPDASAWSAPTLASGFISGGNGQVHVQYRTVVSAGATRVDWRGSVTRSANLAIVTSGLPAMVDATKGRAFGCITDVGTLEVDFFAGACTLVSGSPTWISFDGVSYYL